MTLLGHRRIYPLGLNPSQYETRELSIGKNLLTFDCVFALTPLRVLAACSLSTGSKWFCDGIKT